MLLYLGVRHVYKGLEIFNSLLSESKIVVQLILDLRGQVAQRMAAWCVLLIDPT
jgi:hypothetical protein